MSQDTRLFFLQVRPQPGDAGRKVGTPQANEVGIEAAISSVEEGTENGPAEAEAIDAAGQGAVLGGPGHCEGPEGAPPRVRLLQIPINVQVLQGPGQLSCGGNLDSSTAVETWQSAGKCKPRTWQM